MSDYAFAGKESGPAEKKDKAKFSDWLMSAGSLKKAASQGAKNTKGNVKRLGSTSYLKSRIADTKRNVGERVSGAKPQRTSDMSYSGRSQNSGQRSNQDKLNAAKANIKKSKAASQMKADRAQQVKQMGGNPDRNKAKAMGAAAGGAMKKLNPASGGMGAFQSKLKKERQISADNAASRRQQR